MVDDGSTDDTRGVVESFDRPVRYFRQEHAGVSPARNRGITESKGEFIAFLDSDDVWTEGSLSFRLQQLLENPQADVAYGKTRIVNLSKTEGLRRYREGEAIHHPCFGSMLIRRSAFERIGVIDESFEHSEDIDWVCWAKEGGLAILQTDYVVLEYRIHGGNMTSDIGTNRGFMFRALKQSLDRRALRASGDRQGESSQPACRGANRNRPRKSVLEDWFPRVIDVEGAGYIENFDREWRPTGDAYKSLIYQSRIAWTAAAFSQFAPEHSTDFGRYARIGIDFIDRNLRDREHGGLFYAIDRGGELLRGDEKHTATIGYGILAAARVYMATGYEKARTLARDAFHWIDEHAHDEAGGYHEDLRRDGTPILSGD